MSIEKDVLISKIMTQAYSEKSLSVPIITILDALPLSYRRLVGAKAIKLGSWDKHPTYC